MIALMVAAAVAAPHGLASRVAPPPSVIAAHRAVGGACGWRSGVLGPDISGFTPTRTGPIPLPGGGVVVVRERDGRRFAFLARLTAEEPVASCRVADMAVLPPAREAPTVLRCLGTLGRDARPGSAGWLNGIGVRSPGQRDPAAFWVVRADGRRLSRVDIRAVGLTGRLRCREPEAGD